MPLPGKKAIDFGLECLEANQLRQLRREPRRTGLRDIGLRAVSRQHDAVHRSRGEQFPRVPCRRAAHVAVHHSNDSRAKASSAALFESGRRHPMVACPWVTYVNGGMLCFDYAMRSLAASGTTSPMVKIRIFAGLSTNLLTYYRRRHGVTVPFFNCDGWCYDGGNGLIGRFGHPPQRLPRS